MKNLKSTNLQLIGFFGTKKPIICKIVDSVHSSVNFILESTLFCFIGLAGTMVDLISQNQPSSLDAFIINFQTWVQFVVQTLPVKMVNKGTQFHLNQNIFSVSKRE